MGGACSAYGEKRRCMQGFVVEILGKDNLEDTGLDVRIILRLTFRTWDGGMDLIKLAQDRDRLRALVNAVMNLRVQ